MERTKRAIDSRARLVLALVGLALAVLVVFAPSSSAVELSNPFEIDGNALVDHSGAGLPDDWSRVFDPAAYGAGGYFSKSFIGAATEAPGNDVTYFTGGGSKDGSDIPSWAYGGASAPDKDEITDAYAAAYQVSSGQDAGHTVLYFGMDRYATNGDSNVGFWFLQDPAFGLNGSGGFNGKHVNGDLFVLSAFGNGGSAPTIAVYQWENGSLDLVSSGQPCTSDFKACARVNDSTVGDITVPWAYHPKSGTDKTVAENGFFEGAIDLTSLLGADNLPCVASFVGETRSSDALDAVLKDLAAGNVQSCGSIELKKHWDGKTSSTTLGIGSSAGGSDVASEAVSGADGTTGTFDVKPGTYYVSETPVTNFASSLACENDKTQPPTSVTVGANNSVPVTVGDQIVCTFTNVYQKANPAVTTALSASSVVVGTAVHDSAALVGARAPATGGTVSYKVYDNGNCTPNANTVDAGTKTVTNGVVPDSDPVTLTKVGDYQWQATFSGDADNNGATSVCGTEHLAVKKAEPGVTTTASGPVTVGQAIHDTAHLTGGYNPTGTITFEVFAPGDAACTTPLTPAPASATVNGNGNYDSGNVTATSGGTYRWIAHYSGDANNKAADGSCNDSGESSTVNKANPDIATSASGPVVMGGKVHDVATLSGAIGATGAVTFQVFGPGDTTCDTPLQTLSTASKSVDGNGNGTYTSADFTTTTNGVYRWRAFFAGDGNNTAVSGACNAANESSTAFKPGIFITKTTSTPQVVSGGTATFTITVKNTGDVDLTSVHVTDAQAPDCARTAAQIAADRGSSTFAPNAVYTYQCTLANVTANLTNVATATGTPPEGPDSTATDQASVTVIHPSITVTKTTSTPQVLSGGTATFGITVKNTGDVSLTSVHVTDAQAPGCARTAAQIAADRGSSTFAPNDTYTYSCTLANVAASLTNTATAAGTPPVGPDVTASSNASVAVIHPAISVTKTPDTQAVDSGGTATFTITVKNTGDVTLTNVAVADPLSAGCAKTVGTLAAGQSTAYQCTQSGVTSAFTNVATATGHPPLGPDVTAQASANVTVNPAPSPSPSPSPAPAPPAPTVVDLAIVKTADPASVLQGKNVTYTLTVTNNGPVTDTNVKVADSLPAGVDFVSVSATQGTCTTGNLVQCSLGTMTSGQKVTVTIVASTAAAGSITNTATVVGDLPETNLGNNTSSAPVKVTAPPKPAPKPVFKPPVVKPKPKPVKPKPVVKPVVKKPTPPPCYAVVVAPKSLSAGKTGTLQLKVSAKNKAVAGVKVEVKGPGILKLSGRTNAAGKVSVTLHPKKAGIVLVKPASYKGCATPRVGVIAAFTPPVTG